MQYFFFLHTVDMKNFLKVELEMKKLWEIVKYNYLLVDKRFF